VDDADTVCNSIATFRMQGNKRRDASHGCTGWVFHFGYIRDVEDCRDEIVQLHREAFALGPAAAAVALAAGAIAVPIEPMAYTVVIHKLGIRQDDVESYPFFYLW